MPRKSSTPNRTDSDAKAIAEQELRAVLGTIAQEQGGREALQKTAVEIILPIEERVRRDNPDHPTLQVIDEWRQRGLI